MDLEAVEVATTLELQASSEHFDTNHSSNKQYKLPEFLTAVIATCLLLFGISVSCPIKLAITNVKPKDGDGTPVHVSVFLKHPNLNHMLMISIIGLTIGFGADRFGRKTALLIESWLLATLIILAHTRKPLLSFLIYIFTKALQICAAPVAHAYCLEITGSSMRGTVGSLLGIMMLIGTSPYWHWDYRLNIMLFPFLLLPVVTIVILSTSAPESPVYLVMRNRMSAARLSVVRLRGTEFGKTTEFEELQEEVDADTSMRDSFVSRKVMYRSIIMCFGLMMAAFLLSPPFALPWYTIYKFQDELAAHITGVLASGMIMDRYGRRIALLTSTIGILVCYLAFDVWILVFKRITDELLLRFLTSAYIMFYGTGLDSLRWIMMAEVLPPDIKCTTAVLLNIIYTILVYAEGHYLLGVRFDLFFPRVVFRVPFVSCLVLVFLFYYVHETKGKSLQEIQRTLNS